MSEWRQAWAVGVTLLLWVACVSTAALADVISVGDSVAESFDFPTDVDAVFGAGFVVTSQSPDGQGSWNVLIQRYDPTGARLGTAVVGNSSIGGVRNRPRNTIDSVGGFDVVWEQVNEQQSSDIVARCFDAQGVAIQDELVVNSESGLDLVRPDIGSGIDGSRLVVWQRDSSGSIWGRRLDSTCLPAGPAFEINESGTHENSQPVTVGLRDGTFIVAWARSGGVDTFPAIRARRYSVENGLDPEFQLSGDKLTLEGAAVQDSPSIDQGVHGGFSVAWRADGWYNFHFGARESGIWGRTFDDTMLPVSSDMSLDDGVEEERGYNFEPSVATDNGGFVVVWSSASYQTDYPYGGGAGEFGPSVLLGMHLNVDQNRQNFNVALDDEGELFNPQIASDDRGMFLVTWNRGTSGYTRAFCDVPNGVLGCGSTRCQALQRGAVPATDVTTTDALTVLRGAVGAGFCRSCVCDVNSSGRVTVADALVLLKRAAGLDVPVVCGAC